MGNAAAVPSPPLVNVQNNVNVQTNVHVAIGAGGEGSSVPFIIGGAAGGAAVGSLMGGPVGALVGAAFGGLVGSNARMGSQGRHVTSNPAARGFLPDAELARIEATRAAAEETACKVCLDAQTTIALLPCGHACMCAACTLRLRQRASQTMEPVRCPICRLPTTGCIRTFI